MSGTTIPRRDRAEHDVQIEILFWDICRSDLHSVRSEWSRLPSNWRGQHVFRRAPLLTWLEDSP